MAKKIKAKVSKRTLTTNALPKGMVRLWCEDGEHHWNRPAQRGRKPSSCPDHRPEPVEKSDGPKLILLHCENGDHKWKWKKRGGIPPKNCPEHRTVQKDTEYVELYCEIGKHKWKRERKRGKLPLNCPVHKPVPVTKDATGLAALKQRQQKKNEIPKPVKGLGALKQKRRAVGFKKIQTRQRKRLAEEWQIKIDEAEQAYVNASHEEEEVFKRLDTLEMKKRKTPKTERQIEKLREKWKVAYRNQERHYKILHSTIGAKRNILKGIR
jgi:hypothetical protein